MPMTIVKPTIALGFYWPRRPVKESPDVARMPRYYSVFEFTSIRINDRVIRKIDAPILRMIWRWLFLQRCTYCGKRFDFGEPVVAVRDAFTMNETKFFMRIKGGCGFVLHAMCYSALCEKGLTLRMVGVYP